MAQIQEMISAMPPQEQAQYAGVIQQMQQNGMTDEQIAHLLSQQLAAPNSGSTYEQVLSTLGVTDPDDPSGIYLYPVDFEAKDKIEDIIRTYNESRAEADQITYTDYVGLMMRSVTTIINAISYILISFVAISLVVSSIMIGIITNISVLERTKEIGILRAVGASKRDIRRVFTAETMLVGLAAGLVGIGLTEALIIPINLLIQAVTEINAKAVLDPRAAVILVAISVLLTYMAGLSPARSASRKDPVVALRTE
jgi:putative ABC transport system permease protein